MFQLTIEALDSAFAQSTSLNGLDVFQPGYILVFSAMWIIIKQSLHLFTTNSGRIVGLIHAISTVSFGFPVLLLLSSHSFAYSDMFISFNENHDEIATLCNFLCYISVGYFLMDSYFLVQRTYLKHHIGAIIVWLVAAFHHETSLVHGAVVIALFELGAILVQLSRVFPKIVSFRLFVCTGYTCTRLGLGWYYGFILYSCIQFWPACSVYVQLGYVPIFGSLLFLLVLNAKWTFLQWKAFAKILVSEGGMDFYSYHQKIIGATD